MKPVLGQGYMMFNKVNNPEVDYWMVTLIKKSFDKEGNFTTVIIKEEKLPSGINYINIPSKYRSQSYPTHYLVQVDGMSFAGEIIATEKNVHINDLNNVNDDLVPANGGTPYIMTNCRKTCIGAQYAYSIQQFKRQDVDLSRFRVVPAYKAFDDQSQTANSYYWYSTNDQGKSVTHPTYQIQVLSGVNGHVTQVDPGGNAITGLIWGYQKQLGVWKGQSDIETDGYHTIGDEFCGNTFHDLNSAILLINSSADFSQPTGEPNYPPLECNPADLGGGGGYIPLDNPNPTNVITDFFTAFCIDEYGFPIPPDPANLDAPCNTGTASPNPFGGLTEFVDQLIITDLNNSSNPPITINPLELFDSENVGLNITLQPSLYSFGFMFKAEGYYSKIIEIKEKTNFTVSQADMLDVVIFPSPLYDNDFGIRTAAFATLKFRYELWDFTGELLYSDEFIEKKDHVTKRTIKVKNIPEGIMLHRFIFEDGSVKTMQTIRN